MLDSVGKKILSTDDSNEYESVVEMQNIITASKKIAQDVDLEDISMYDSVEEKKMVVEKLVNALEKSLSTEIWEKFASGVKENVRAFFDYFKLQDVKLASVSVAFDKDKKYFEEIVKDSKTKELLVQELIKDDYYDLMICKDGNPEDVESDYEFI